MINAGDTMGKSNSQYWTKVQPNFDLIGAWIRDGYTQEEIAHELGISKKTLTTYMQKHMEFKQLWNDNRQRVDLVHVANAYYKCCLGYTVVEETRKYVYGEDGERKLVSMTERERHIPPNPVACEKWISARFQDYLGWEDFGKKDASYDVEEAAGGVILIPERYDAKNAHIVEFKSQEIEKGLDDSSPVPDEEYPE